MFHIGFKKVKLLTTRILRQKKSSFEIMYVPICIFNNQSVNSTSLRLPRFLLCITTATSKLLASPT